MAKTRITESELVLPSLFLMSIRQDGTITTSELIKQLEAMLHPQGMDAEILNGRSDTYFSQKVRNLKSHNTLTRYGYAQYSYGVFSITNKGRQLVEANKDNLHYILSSGFVYDDIKNTFGRIYNSRGSKIIPYDELISEGATTVQEKTEVRVRSSKLRRVAIEHFTKNGIISCDCCGFEFKAYYGDEYGKPCIEIHHLKPIFQYPSMSITQTIDQALSNLLPVCPNCHRVIHKNNITADDIPQFRNRIHGRFDVVLQQIDQLDLR